MKVRAALIALLFASSTTVVASPSYELEQLDYNTFAISLEAKTNRLTLTSMVDTIDIKRIEVNGTRCEIWEPTAVLLKRDESVTYALPDDEECRDVTEFSVITASGSVTYLRQ